MAALLDAKNRSVTANGKNIVFSPDAAQPAAPTGKATTRVVVGRKASLAYASVGKFLPAAVGAEVWAALVAAAPGGDGGGSTSTLAIEAAGGAARSSLADASRRERASSGDCRRTPALTLPSHQPRWRP